MKYNDIIGAAFLGFFVTMSLSFSALSNAETEEISGAKVINDNCARCHNARPVQEFSLEEWSVIMPHMREKAHLTGAETQAVMKFMTLVTTKVKSDPKMVEETTLLPSGQELMTRYGCQGCHSFSGQGGNIGPTLDGIVASKGKVFVKRKLLDPQFNNPQSPMPKMPLSEAEVLSLIEFLSGSAK